MSTLFRNTGAGWWIAKGIMCWLSFRVSWMRFGALWRSKEELKVRNAELPENRKMEFRIGINLGDVVEEEETIYGDGVNIAARVEGLAEGGGICISRTVFDSYRRTSWMLDMSIWASIQSKILRNLFGSIGSELAQSAAVIGGKGEKGR